MSRRTAANVAGVSTFALGTGILIWRVGVVFLLRDWMWVWIGAGLLAISLTDLRGLGRRLVVDWLPFVAIIIGYDFVRGIGDRGVPAAHYRLQIAAERHLFGGLPTVWLQHHLWHLHHRHAYDFAVWAVYNTHFLVTVVVAAVLWRVARESFKPYRTMVAALALAGMVTFIAYPTLPPWLAARHGHIPQVSRIVEHMWHHVGVHEGGALFESGSRWANQVAAFPSLHAAYPMLLLLFFWSRAGWWRILLVAYVAFMAFTLVYSGEHYAVDVLGGWAYAAVVFAVVRRLYDARDRRREQAALSEAVDEPAPEPVTAVRV